MFKKIFLKHWIIFFLIAMIFVFAWYNISSTLVEYSNGNAHFQNLMIEKANNIRSGELKLSPEELARYIEIAASRTVENRLISFLLKNLYAFFILLGATLLAFLIIDAKRSRDN